MAGRLAYSVRKTNNTDVWVYHHDGLGSVRTVTDLYRNVVETKRTDAWGDRENRAGVIAESFGFTGEQKDYETGFSYLRARYYDPSIGQFLSRDTVDGDRAKPGTLNRYAYAGSNPVLFTDPSGHDYMSINVSIGPSTGTLYLYLDGSGNLVGQPSGGVSASLVPASISGFSSPFDPPEAGDIGVSLGGGYIVGGQFSLPSEAFAGFAMGNDLGLSPEGLRDQVVAQLQTLSWDDVIWEVGVTTPALGVGLTFTTSFIVPLDRFVPGDPEGPFYFPHP